MEGKENIEAVWNEFSSGLKLFIHSKVENEADASDILQDTFLKIHENIHTLKDKSRLKSWIYQITRNIIIDYYKVNNRNKMMKDNLPGLNVSTLPYKLMDEALTDMVMMMEKLSPEYCEALCLIEIEGMSQKEFAEKKGLSYSGAKSRVQRSRAMLKDLLLKCCHYQFDKYGTVIDIQPWCCCCCAQKNNI